MGSKVIIRIVLDTNIYIASSSPNSYISQFIFARKPSVNPYTLYISPQILVEVHSTLVNKMHRPQSVAAAYIRSVQQVTEMVYPRQQITIVRDPDDNKILECAMECAANMIITADKDLLDLKAYGDIAILHPRQLTLIFADVFKT